MSTCSKSTNVQSVAKTVLAVAVGVEIFSIRNWFLPLLWKTQPRKVSIHSVTQCVMQSKTFQYKH